MDEEGAESSSWALPEQREPEHAVQQIRKVRKISCKALEVTAAQYTTSLGNSMKS